MKNIELIPRETLNAAAELVKHIQQIKADALSAVEALKGIGGTTSRSTRSKDPMEATVVAEREIVRLKNEQIKAEAQLTAMVTNTRRGATQATAERNRQLQLERAIAAENAAQEGSLERARKTLARLYLEQSRINKSTAEGQRMYDAMGDEIADVLGKVTQLEQARGQFSRNVGNYGSAFSVLGFQTQQLLREAPTAINLQQFFLAISNNLPMYADAIRQEHANIRMEIEKTGKASTTIGRQIIKGFASWQTVLIVGIALLSKFGAEAIKWVGDLIRSMRGVDQARLEQEAFIRTQEKAIDSIGEEITKLDLLYRASQDTTRSIKDRKAIIDELQRQYPNYLQNISDEEFYAGKAAGSYDKLRNSILQKAITQAAADEIAEIEIKRFKELQELANDPKGPGVVAQIGLALTQSFTRFASEGSKAANFYNGVLVSTMDQASARQSNAITKVNDKYDEQRAALEGLINVEDLFTTTTEKGAVRHIKSLNKERDALEQLATAEIDARIAALRRYEALNVADVQTSMDVINKRYDLEEERIRKLARIQEQNIISEEMDRNAVSEAEAIENTLNQTEALHRATNEKIIQNAHEREQELRAIQDRSIQESIAAQERLIAFANRQLDDNEIIELADLSDEYSQGLMHEENYQRRRNEIVDFYTNERNAIELEAMRSRLMALQSDSLKTIDEEQAILELEQDIAQQELAIKKTTIEQEVALEQQRAQRIRSIRDQLISGLFNIAQQLVDLTFAIEEEALDARQEQSERLYESETDRIDRLAEHGAITDEQAEARKALVEQQARIREEKLAKERAELQKRQARLGVIVQTAQAIAVALASSPWPINLIPIGFAVASGALQLAMIDRARYAKGTPKGGHPGGAMVVGDGGRAEMIISPDGSVSKSPSHSTFIPYAEPGTVVLPDWNKAIQEIALSGVIGRKMNAGKSEVYKDNNVIAQLKKNNMISAAMLRETINQKTKGKFNEFKNRDLN